MTIYNSTGNQIDIAQIAIYNYFLQIKSNVGFLVRGENRSTRGKTSFYPGKNLFLPGEKPFSEGHIYECFVIYFD